jgi:F-type H+-transporting ATPase subunit b
MRKIFLFLFLFVVSLHFGAFFPACGVSIDTAFAASQEGEHAQGEAHEESIWQTIGKWLNFFALVAILYLFLKKTIRVQDKFKADAEEIEKSIESARQAKEDAEKRLRELEQRIEQMNQEVERVKAAAAKEAEEEKQRILDSAGKEAERIVEMAHREIDAEVRRARKELRRQVAESAVGMGRTLIEKEINEEDHKRLVSSYIEEFGK